MVDDFRRKTISVVCRFGLIHIASLGDWSLTCQNPPRAGFALWFYYRFNLSSRDIEDLMAERGIAISYESIQVAILVECYVLAVTVR